MLTGGASVRRLVGCMQDVGTVMVLVDACCCWMFDVGAREIVAGAGRFLPFARMDVMPRFWPSDASLQ